MAAVIVYANKRAFPGPLRAVTTRSSARFYRDRLDQGAPVPWLRWPQQQSHHPLDVDHQPGQQILDAVPPTPAIARPASIVLPHHFGQFAFDRRMFTARLLVARSGRFEA